MFNDESALIPFDTSPLPDGPWLVFAPHPDDETLGCGGTLYRHKNSGDELFWLIITFGILYLVLSKVVLPKISDNLETRKSQVLENLELAEKQRNDSEAKLKELRGILTHGTFSIQLKDGLTSKLMGANSKLLSGSLFSTIIPVLITPKTSLSPRSSERDTV